jgi:hypothetical protein
LCWFIKDSILQFNFNIIAICWWIWIELFMYLCHRAKRTAPNDLTSQALPRSLGPFFFPHKHREPVQVPVFDFSMMIPVISLNEGPAPLQVFQRRPSHYKMD